MTHRKSIAFVSALIVVAGSTLVGCDSKDQNGKQPVVEVPAAPASAQPERTHATLLARSQERFDQLSLNDSDGWIAAYDFFSPALKKEVDIATFLNNVKVHKYENPRALEVVGEKDDVSFVRVSVVWTPQHELIKAVKLEPGQTLTSKFEMIESWAWTGKTWHMTRLPQREDEFFEMHPEFLRKGASTTTPAAGEGG